MRAARIVLSAATLAIDRPYTYAVPEELRETLLPGMRVLVPFGAGNKVCEGLVLSLSEEDGKGLKAVRTVLDSRPVLEDGAIRLALWMRERYFCTVYAAAMTMLPTGLWYVLKEVYALAPGVERAQAEAAVADSPKGKQLIQMLYALGGRADLEQIKAIPDLKAPMTLLRRLLKEGILVRDAAVRRNVGDKTEKIAVLTMPPGEAMALAERQRRRSPLRYAVTELLCSLERVSVKELCYFTGADRKLLREMAKKGVLSMQEQEVYRHTLPEGVEQVPLSELNEEQTAALAGLTALTETGKPQAALLYGVTGSGKTQVYLHLIQRMLDRGRGAIVMVPEIALTPNLLRQFMMHFGSQVAVLHSCLSAGERYDAWKRVRDGKARVVIGTRSAVFAPVESLGLVILDEEQEGSYQSESNVRYHAREVAKFRCAQSGGLLLLGSATPAVESRYAAETGQYHLFTLNQRYNTRPMPPVHIVDMKEELRQGCAGGLSRLLRQELEENIQRGEQSILFLNRRGNSRMAVCCDCGQVPSCPNCTVHLTYHSANGRLMCHYCGHSEPVPATCPTCNGRLQFVGLGTQRLQEELQEAYPGVEVMRMDADSISATQTHEVLLDRFRRKKIPILLGTQMVAKGLDFPDVTLVGVIDADLSLYTDSYRSAERTFSLLTQVVGRAGRGERSGRAVVQTWTPDNDVITLSAQQDYDAFYAGEREMRRLLKFPPFTDLFRITVSGPEESQVLRLCAMLHRSLEPWVFHRRETGEEAELLGPAPAGVVKVNNRFRYRLLLKGKNNKETRGMLSRLLREAQQDRINKGMSVLVDVNPMD